MNKEKKRKPLSKKKKRLILIIAAACLLVLAACYTVFIAPLLEKEQWVYKEATVERGTLKVGVTESGSLEYGIQSVTYDLDLSVASSDSEDDEEDTDDSSDSEETVQKYLKIEEIYVAAGQRIEAGDVLVKFTEDSVSDVRRLLESALVDAQAEYAEAQSDYNLSALEAETDFETGMLESEYADVIYQKGTQSVDNEIAAAKIKLQQANAKISSLEEAVTEAQEAYNEARSAYEEAQASYSAVGPENTVNFMVYQKGFLSARTQYENAKSALSRAEQSLEDNAAEIDSLQKEITALQAARTLNKLSAEQNWQTSLINGENAEITYQAQMESLKETLQEAADEKEKVQAQMEAFEAFVGEDGCLYAERSGIVTGVSYEAGDRLRNAGVMISYATPEDMTLSVDVTQEDIVDLKVGDMVDITFTAYEDTSYEGTIQSINTTATATGSNTVSYTVVIGVEGDTGLLYGGMTADIIFVTEQKDDVLYISRKAIVEENGKTYVYCKTALGGRELKEVETGINNGINIEIVSGLSEGDTIYLASRVSSQEEIGAGEDTEENTVQGENAGDGADGAIALPDGMEMPEGMEMPSGGEMPSGFGGGSGGNGSQMPGGSGSFGGNSGGNMSGGAGGGMSGGKGGR